MIKLIRAILKKISAKNKKGNSTVSIDNHTGLDDTYLFDFKNYSSGYRNSSSGFNTFIGTNPVGDPTQSTDIVVGVDMADNSPDKEAQPSLKLKVKPIDVLNELETVPTPFTLIGIEEKISILKDKEALITQVYAKREVKHLIERISNRKKYLKHKEFFDSFQNTTDQKIEALLSKYELVMKTSDIFIPEFPDVAIKTMKDYTEKVKLICDKKPVFYVIADEDKFKKAWDQRDPILLVQSPFGFYWQILGAWDKEMLILGEL